MILRREQLEEMEAERLAPYAMLSRNSRGRAHPEAEHPYRTAFQRDRDRILHTTAFRRLEYKTQVFVNYEGDYYRTRLTHTLEVAQIGRTIARAMGANEDLVEAISLAHDLGHTPFGHSGEEALHKLMANHGGFDHNRQSLRIVEELEERYAPFLAIIRERRPDTPIICITAIFSTNEVLNPAAKQPGMREIIRAAVAERRAMSDTNIYLVEGCDLLGPADRDGLVDTTHPNDVGFLSMADGLEPTLREALGL